MPRAAPPAPGPPGLPPAAGAVEEEAEDVFLTVVNEYLIPWVYSPAHITDVGDCFNPFPSVLRVAGVGRAQPTGAAQARRTLVSKLGS